MKEICQACHCQWAQSDGNTYYCTMPVCQNEHGRKGTPLPDVREKANPCSTCAGYRGGACKVICGRYKRWMSVNWQAITERIRRRT